MKTLVNTFYNLELRLIENAITVLSSTFDSVGRIQKMADRHIMI